MACAHGNETSHTEFLIAAAELLSALGSMSEGECNSLLEEVKSARQELLTADIHRSNLEAHRDKSVLVASGKLVDALEYVGLSEEEVSEMEGKQFHALFVEHQKRIAEPIVTARRELLSMLEALESEVVGQIAL